MTTTAGLECPKCGFEFEVECEIGEGVYLDSFCEDCSHIFTQDEYYKMCSNAEIRAIEKLTDRAMDKDR